MKCDCKNEYQDKKYGAHNRVFNIMTKGSKKYRCTVCGKDI